SVVGGSAAVGSVPYPGFEEERERHSFERFIPAARGAECEQDQPWPELALPPLRSRRAQNSTMGRLGWVSRSSAPPVAASSTNTTRAVATPPPTPIHSHGGPSSSESVRGPSDPSRSRS